MRLIPITSSSIAAIGWKDTKLGVLFQQGAAYLYDDVPMEVFVQVIMDEDSQGKAFDRLVKRAGYPYTRVTLEYFEEL